MRHVVPLALVCVIGLAAADTARGKPVPHRFRAYVNRAHPCLARIIDREDPSWDPTISFGGGHNVNDSYGLGQANPGTKMARYGKQWRTNPWVQLRWMRAYSMRYGGECSSWWFWQTHAWW